MRILFFNLWHIGDTFFAQPSVKCVCLSNPDQEFLLLHRYNHNLYQNIPNLHIMNAQSSYLQKLQDGHEPSELVNRNEMISELEHHCAQFYQAPLHFKVNDDIIAINTWIGAMFPKFGREIECNPMKLYSAMRDIIQEVNHVYSLSLNYKEIELQYQLPNLHDGQTDVAAFKEWKRSHNRKCIFYYNYFPRSGQVFPCGRFNDHLEIIKMVTKILPDVYIVVPRISEEVDNVINCESFFGIQETPDCANLTQMALIADECEASVHYNVGACFYYMNTQMLDKTRISKKIHICGSGDDSMYFPMTNMELLQAISCDINRLVILTDCNTVVEISDKLPRLLMEIL